MESTTTAQLKTIYEDLQQKLRQQATSASSIDQERKTEIMNLLHDFNDVKDAAQIVVGALANLEPPTWKVQQQLN
ncbi:uncharacterized protein isoform X3 [Musca autumnalis]|uniref:uncharacterized protein isoform X3 n=1 Tax=Musca autumnalis TaxID=221902 RepID=UPI003CF69A39